MNQRDEQQRKKDAAFAVAVLKGLMSFILALSIGIMVYSFDSAGVFDAFLDRSEREVCESKESQYE